MSSKPGVSGNGLGPDLRDSGGSPEFSIVACLGDTGSCEGGIIVPPVLVAAVWRITFRVAIFTIRPHSLGDQRATDDPGRRSQSISLPVPTLLGSCLLIVGRWPATCCQKNHRSSHRAESHGAIRKQPHPGQRRENVSLVLISQHIHRMGMGIGSFAEKFDHLASQFGEFF